MKEPIHFLARGICVSEGKILLAWHKENEYFFLPGGHVEHGESSSEALARELKEELGVDAVIGSFVQLFEHSWQNGDALQHELTVVFRVSLSEPGDSLKSMVEHLSFHWLSIESFEGAHFLPGALKGEVAIQLRGNGSQQPFISTM